MHQRTVPTLWLVCTVVMALVAGCVIAQEKRLDNEALQGRWELVTVDNQPVDAESEMYFSIDGETITGFDGCNRFSGALQAPGSLVMTQRGCTAPEFEFPLNLADPRGQLSAATVENDRLTLPTIDNSGTAVFQRR